MQVRVERAAFLKALAHVQSVVERRNTIPILSNVLLEADADGLKLMATDLDLQIVERVEARTDAPGAITVAAHTLFDIVRKLADGAQVELKLADGRLAVAAGRARAPRELARRGRVRPAAPRARARPRVRARRGWRDPAR